MVRCWKAEAGDSEFVLGYTANLEVNLDYMVKYLKSKTKPKLEKQANKKKPNK